ncbi:MAG: sensor histidine kinase, partial [Spirochaetaceae bacterium]|nr:sensor histidine kinase [Spirochaetaceae bacterium]
MKHRTASLAAALFCWVSVSALALFIFWVMRDRARLIRDNDKEQILGLIFTRFRNVDDFGDAIGEDPFLSERVAGFAQYGEDFAPLYRWGRAPPAFDGNILEQQKKSRFGRYTIPDKQEDRVKVVFHLERQSQTPRIRERMRDMAEHHQRARSAPAPPRTTPT